MPKLIIPNGLDLNQSETYVNTYEEAKARQFYCMRFLWLLNIDDIIILPRPPNKQFLTYLGELKKIDHDKLKIIEWENDFSVPTSEALKHPTLIKRIRKAMANSNSWSIQTCFFNKTILTLAEDLKILVKEKWRRFALNNFGRYLNSKAQFRDLSKNFALPIPQGKICKNEIELNEALVTLLPVTKQVILKQEYNAGGRGNIGIGLNTTLDFKGATKTIATNMREIDRLSKQIWHEAINKINHQLIAEVYHANSGTFTTNLYIQNEQQRPHLLNYAEIRMEKTWIGVQMPAHSLTKDQSQTLVKTAQQYANLIQAQGYEGYLCCDAIRTVHNEILFTEINVRPSAETHAHALASYLFGINYYQRKTLLTRKDIKIKTFEQTHNTIKTQGLLFNTHRKTGAIILTIDDQEAKLAEYLIIGNSFTEAVEIERKMLDLFR